VTRPRSPHEDVDTAGPPPSMWRVTVAALGLVALLQLTAAGADASTAQERRAAEAAEFDRVYAQFQGWFLGEHDEHGTSYEHWRFQDLRATGNPTTSGTAASGTDAVRRIDAETDYARMGRGRDITVLRRDRLSRPGFSLDYLHPGGTDIDYVLIGERYRQPVQLDPQLPTRPLWPTLWMARPTTLSQGWDPCATGGTALFCDLDSAVAATRAAIPDVPRSYHRSPDGAITARTAIRFYDLITYDIAPTNARQLAQLQPAFTTLIPLTITFDSARRFVRAELNGRLTTDGAVLEVQLGIERRGTATAADFPAPPSNAHEITHANHLDAYVFAKEASDLRDRESAGEDESPPR
jgi:hypothetical protein